MFLKVVSIGVINAMNDAKNVPDIRFDSCYMVKITVSDYMQNTAYSGTDFKLFSKPKFFAEIRIE